MPSYDWRLFQRRDLRNRFPDSATGYPQWADLVDTVEQFPPVPFDWMCRQALDAFMTALAPVTAAVLAKRKKDCRLFVSHRRGSPDEEHAQQIAWHATQHGYEYWLDVDDPVLVRVNGQPIASPAKDVLIAAIIEIALLNCSHLLAVITQQSAGSRWIPYEFGRAKLQLVLSDNSSIWLDNNTSAAGSGAVEHHGLGSVRVGMDVWHCLLPSGAGTIRLGIPPRREEFLIIPIVVSEIGTSHHRRRGYRQVGITFEDYVIGTTGRTPRDPRRPWGGLILATEHHRILLRLEQFRIPDILIGNAWVAGLHLL
jgi:hypothetical protein